MDFYTWLLKQDRNRDDIISDLASDIKRDKSFPKNCTDIESLRNHLIVKGDHIMEALDEAWTEFNYNKTSRK